MEQTNDLRGRIGFLEDLTRDAVTLFREPDWPQLAACLHLLAQTAEQVAKSVDLGRN